jgi:hypothetical protein
MILVKTEAGHQVLKDRSVRLTPRQRSAFILFDGKRSVAQVLESGMGIEQEDIAQMVELGLLGPGAAAAGAVATSSVREPADPGQAPAAAVQAEGAVNGARSHQQRYKDAYPIATQLTASLGLRGFRLNLSVEGTSSYEELVQLLPKIRAAAGADKTLALERALGGD